MSKVVIKINGKDVLFFENFVFSSQIDTISSTLTFDTFGDIEEYEFSEVQALRNDVIIFTGKITGKSIPNSDKPEPFTYKCYSTPKILEDCTLPLEYYPIQTQDKSIGEIIESICNIFNVSVKFDSSADVSGKYSFQNQSPDKKAIDIINELCSEKKLILTHNSLGELLITGELKGNEAKPPTFIKSSVSFNYNKFYNKYLVVGQQSIKNEAARQAQVTFDQIESTRNITKIQRNGDADSVESQANSMKFDSYKSNSLTIDYPDYFANTGDIFIFGNIKMICNSMNYNYKSGIELCSVNLLNSKIYERNI